MRSFFKFIQRFHFFLLFVFLEVISISIVINSYTDKKSKFIGSANAFTGYLHAQITGITDYLHLKEDNIKLAKENAQFRNILKSSFKENYVSKVEIKDSLYSQQYFHIAAKVINNSTHKNHNYITINKGSKHGIKEDMAIISPEGVVGVVTAVSRNFALGMSILNTNFGLSGKLKNNNYFGSISWKGDDYTEIALNDIPNHVHIEPGDSIITSSFSALFPEGIMIGTIENYLNKPGDSFYEIDVELSVDFKKLHYVYVVGNFLRNEQLELETEIVEQ